MCRGQTLPGARQSSAFGRSFRFKTCGYVAQINGCHSGSSVLELQNPAYNLPPLFYFLADFPTKELFVRTSVILFLSALLVQKSAHCVPPVTSKNTLSYLLENRTNQPIYFSVYHKKINAPWHWFVTAGVLTPGETRALPFIPSRHVTLAAFKTLTEYAPANACWLGAAKFRAGHVSTTHFPPLSWIQNKSAHATGDRRQISTIILPRYSGPDELTHPEQNGTRRITLHA